MWTVREECIHKEKAVGCGKCDVPPEMRHEEWTVDWQRGGQQHGSH